MTTARSATSYVSPVGAATGAVRRPTGTSPSAPRGLREVVFFAAGAGLVASVGGALGLFFLNVSNGPFYASALLFIALLLTGVIIAAQPGSTFGGPPLLALLSYVAFIGAGPLFSLARRWGYELPDVGTGYSQLVAWAGIGCMLLGYLAVRDRRPKSPKKDEHGLNPHIILYVGLLYTLVGIGAIVAYLSVVGGVQYLLETPYGIRRNPSVYAGGFGLLRPGLFLLLAWVLEEARGRIWFFLLLFYAIGDIMWFGPLHGSRHHVLTLLLTLAYLTRRNLKSRFGRASMPARRLLIVAAVALVVTWGFLRVFSIAELAGSRISSGELAEGTTAATLAAFHAPFDAFVKIVTRVPDASPYLYGSSFYESLTMVIPRNFWSAKPLGLGGWLEMTWYGGGFGNSVPTWPGELYLNFGLPGVVLGMFLTGMLLKWMARNSPPRQAIVRGSVFRCLPYAASFPLVLDLLWGSSNSAVWYFWLNIFPVLVALRLAGRRRGS